MSKRKSILGREARLAYMEAELFETGQLYTGTLMKLGIERQQASRDLNWYIEQHPRAMRYCGIKKRYFLNADHRPALVSRGEMPRLIQCVNDLVRILESGNE